VGVGSAAAASEFATQLGVSPSICFGDEDGVVGESLELLKGVGTMWNPPAVGKMMERNNQESLTLLGQSYKKAADNIGIQKLAPTNIEDTLRQGGTFIFKGNTPLVAHYDEKVGDNYDIESTLGLIATK